LDPASIFLTIGAAYLALVAYGVVRTRKKGVPPPVRFVSATVQVLLPPLVMFGALLLSRNASLIGGWGIMLAMLLVAGALLALCTDQVAKRVL
jgi:hypothetical protein